MNRPLVTVTISFILGIASGVRFNLSPGLLLLLSAGFLILTLLYCVQAWQENCRVFVLLFFILGWTNVCVDIEKPANGPEEYAGRHVILEGIVAVEPQLQQDSVRYTIEAKSIKHGARRLETSGKVLVRAPGNGPVYQYGDLLQVGGVIYIPREPSNFDVFNYRDYLERRGIQCLLYVNKNEDLKLLGKGAGSKILLLASKVKGRLTEVAGQTMDDRQAAVIGGLLFGNRDGIDDQTMDIFANTGVAHVLCVSGLHVGYVLAGVLGLAGLLRLSGRWVLFLAPALMLFYAAMTGMSPAVVRAVLMATIVLLAAYLGRERDWPTGLALAALVILLINPAYLFEIGFQLSFTATWGILYLGPALGDFLRNRLLMPGWLAMPLQVTLAAQLATLPVLLYYFNLLALVAPLANLLLVPMVGVVMLFGFVGCVSGIVFLPLAGLINFATGVLIDLFLGLAGLIESFPWAKVYLAAPPWYVFPAWYGCLALAVQTAGDGVTLFSKWGISRYVNAAIGVCLAVFIFWPWNGTGGQMEVHFIDVGQGDSVLMRFPGGRAMLVDAGGVLGDPEKARAVGDNTVVPYLRRLGINQLDAVAVTHPHEDHVGGIPAVLEKFDVGALVLTGAPGYSEFLTNVSKKTKIYRVGSGQTLRLDNNVDVYVIGPDLNFETQSASEDDLNNTSLVLAVEYGQVSFLLTGDIEAEAQRELVASGVRLKTTVLKAPHHGSGLFEPEFFTAAAPDYAVIQVGERNRFGHPAQTTLQALAESGAKILRTDRDGAVVFETDGEKLNVKTARPITGDKEGLRIDLEKKID
ncbi:competence protein ComEC [Desulfotomaculum arcticum]|uniref:Competence protein ComEC n=1 Tax=Desulfotruncus arcticus DSM 17038 TaxID=1121424 RepID=A0A1I2Z3U9_9FIRM|nr:DNA internalization-related competence protein ComEC/Rec2 [Desulfotruncus arcticus]SFH32474.1 competence protein ComEC [Desulfotomaculum arcticum] [Desulfotruncus arcticus DSM 17038]